MSCFACGKMLLKAATGLLLSLAVASGCVPSSVIGPLQHEREEQEKIMTRARRSGVSEEVVKVVFSPLTPEEVQTSHEQNDSCRSSYVWKNGLTWTGSVFVSVAAGATIAAAYATGNNDTTPKLVYGVSAASLAAVGSILVALGGIIQQGFTDRGCWVR